MMGPAMLLFGGYSKDGGYSNALYSLHVERGVWCQPTVLCGEGAAPPIARLGVTATALSDDEAMLFGGSHRGRPCGALDLLRASGPLSDPQSSLHVHQPAVQGNYTYCS